MALLCFSFSPSHSLESDKTWNSKYSALEDGYFSDQVCSLTDVNCLELQGIEIQITINCMAEVPEFGTYMSIYSCSNLSIVQLNHPVGSYLPVGTYLEEVVITDEVSAATSCIFSFEIIDEESPNIAVNTTHFPVYNEDPNINIPDLSNYVSATTDDGCSDLSITQDPAAGTGISGYGDYLISFYAEDANGNLSTTVSFPLHLRHPGIITPSCQSDITISNDPGLCEGSYIFSPPAVPYGGVIQTLGMPSGSQFPLGVNLVEFTSELMVDTVIKFTWDNPLKRIGVPDIGPAGTNGSPNAVYISNPSGGFAIQSPDSLDLVMPLEFLDNIKGMEIGFDYAANSSRLTDAVNVGTHFEFDLDTNVYIRYKILTPFNSIITVNEQHIFDIPEDDQFHSFLFRYDNRTGVAEIFMDEVVMWTSDNPVPNSDLYFGTGNEFRIGTDCNDNGTKLDNLFINKYTSNETCQFNIEVVDNDPPVPICHNDTILYASNNSCDRQLFYNINGSDLCSGISNINQLSGLPSGSFFPLGFTMNNFELTDGAGNSSTCSFSVTVLDTISPTINCSEPITLPADSFACGSFATFEFDVSDNCGIVDTTHISGIVNGDFISLGIHSSTYEFSDASGNSVQCTYTIIVEDDMAPVIDCSDLEVFVNADCSFIMPNLASLAMDNCDLDIGIMQTPIPGTVISYDAPILPIISAIDNEGNNSQCAINLIITDTIMPVIDCIMDTTIYTDPNLCGANFTYPNGAQDNCPDLFFQQFEGPTSGSVFGVGDTDVGRLVQDIGANKDSCHFVVTVIDSIRPSLDCSPMVVYDLDNDCQEIVYYDLSTRASDACIINYTQLISGPPSGSIFNEGITAIEFMAMDMNGNSDTCIFNIEVLGGVNWTIDCPDDQMVKSGPECDYILNDYTSDASLIDYCNRIITITQDPDPMSVVSGNTTVTLTAQDDLGTMQSCSFTLIAEDFEDPQIMCPSDTTIFLPENLCEIEFEYEFSATDNCYIDTVMMNGYLSGELIPVGLHEIQGIVRDGVGRTDTCSFFVTVIDSIPPSFPSCSDIEIEDDDGDCFVSANYILDASDICGVDSIVLLNGPLPNDIIPADSTYLIEYKAIDIHGNENYCSFNLHAVGFGSWNFGTLEDQTQYVDSGCQVVILDYRPMVPINTICATVELTQEPEPGTMISSNTTVTITGTNDFNTEDLEFEVLLADTLNPVITCPNDTVIYTTDGLCGVYFEYEIFAEDNCEIEVFGLVNGIESNALFPVATTLVDYYISDVSGNNNSCSFTVEVLDVDPPILSCDSVFEICVSEAIIPQPVIVDDCDWINLINNYNETDNASDTYPVGTTPITWSVQDVHGNMSTCDQLIVIHEEPDDAYAGEDQELFFGNSTEMHANIPEVGEGTWNIIHGGGDVQDVNSANSVIQNMPFGENVFEWVITHENCDLKSDTVVIRAIDIVIPSGYSPDDDHLNDYFEIQGIQFFPKNKLTVFNRWGAVVYEKHNYQNEWDGKNKSGLLLPMDTYYFTLEIDDLRQPYSGFVVIKY